MDIINLVLYKEAKKVAKRSKEIGGGITFESFYAWLLEVKSVRPDIETVLLKENRAREKKLKRLSSGS